MEARKNCWESLGQQGDQTSQSQGKSTLNTRWKDRCWSWSSSILVIWCKQEKAMATHSSTLAWKTPGTEEPGGLPSMGSHRVGHDWCDLAAAAAADSLGKSLMLGKIEGRRREHQRMRCLDGITKARGMNLGKLQEMVRDRVTCHVAVHGVTKSQTWLNDSTTTTTKSEKYNNRRWLGKCWLA